MFKQPTQQSIQAPVKSKSFEWKWEKHHTLLLIGLACLALWWFAPSLKTWPLFQSSLNLLPTIGGLAFALETMLKLAD